LTVTAAQTADVTFSIRSDITPTGTSGTVKLECTEGDPDPNIPKIKIEVSEGVALTFTNPRLYHGEPQLGGPAKPLITIGGLYPNGRDRIDYTIVYTVPEKGTWGYTKGKAGSTHTYTVSRL
jgi:hypothetical protein